MKNKKFLFFLFFFLTLISLLYFFLKINENKVDEKILFENEEIYNSNIIKNVSYISRDLNGNEYNVKADEGEIDLKNNNVIFLKNVISNIKLTNKNNIIITSDFGKYNINNYDTIFNDNVVVKYLDNKITGEYLDFSFNRNSMIISRNVIYTNSDNILKANVIEMDIKTKDTKIYMYDSKKKVNIKSKDSYGNN